MRRCRCRECQVTELLLAVPVLVDALGHLSSTEFEYAVHHGYLAFLGRLLNLGPGELTKRARNHRGLYS
jgi:hypothetical protein